MFKCKEKSCGHVFEEADESLERYHDVRGTSAVKSWPECPACHCDYFSDAKRCKSCEEYHFEDELEHGLCKKCGADTRRRFDLFVLNNFDEAEKEYLRETWI